VSVHEPGLAMSIAFCCASLTNDSGHARLSGQQGQQWGCGRSPTLPQNHGQHRAGPQSSLGPGQYGPPFLTGLIGTKDGDCGIPAALGIITGDTRCQSACDQKKPRAKSS
jgi:hypothetical protein